MLFKKVIFKTNDSTVYKRILGNAINIKECDYLIIEDISTIFESSPAFALRIVRQNRKESIISFLIKYKYSLKLEDGTTDLFYLAKLLSTNLSIEFRGIEKKYYKGGPLIQNKLMKHEENYIDPKSVKLYWVEEEN